MKPSWNLSGSYQQVIPRYISTDAKGNDEKEFLNDYFPDLKSLTRAIFLKADIWWESNLKHLFPVGEVNGSHGVYRPGGSALNSGQVGSLRAAQYISRNYSQNPRSAKKFLTDTEKQVSRELAGSFLLADHCLTHFIYLEAIKSYLEGGGRSRGSYIVVTRTGKSKSG